MTRTEDKDAGDLTPQGTLRVGMIGAGWVTQYHLASWAQIRERARVVAIADPKLDQARTRAAQHGIEKIYASAEQMLAEVELDAIDIAAPREFHARLVRLASRRGLGVLCQKPIAPNFEEARMLVEDVARRCRLMVHENWRFRPYYRDLRDWLHELRIGEVVQAQMTLLTSGLVADIDGKLPALERQPFLAGLERALVMEVLIHHIDTLRFLLGELTFSRAWLGRSSAAIRGEDRAFACFESQTGAPVSLLANLHVHGRPAAQTDQLTLIGSEGAIELKGDTLRCWGARPEERRYDLASSYSQSYLSAITHFVDCLSSGAPFETNPDDNLRTLKLVEQIYAEPWPGS